MKAHDVLAAVEQLPLLDKVPGLSKYEVERLHRWRAEVIRMLRGPVSSLHRADAHRHEDAISFVARGLQRKGQNREAEWLMRLGHLTELLERRDG